MTALGWVGIVRHGQSTANVAMDQAEAAGLARTSSPHRDADVPLTEQGRAQARAVGQWLADLPAADRPDLVVASPYLRTADTARIALATAYGNQTPALLFDERLRDRELGVLDLHTSHGVAELFPEELARKQHLGRFYYRPPGGESWADVTLRIRTLLSELRGEHAGRRVLFVAHEMTVFLLRYLLEGVPEPELLRVAVNNVVANGSITTWEPTAAGGYRMVLAHSIEHLRRHGALPTVTDDAATQTA